MQRGQRTFQPDSNEDQHLQFVFLSSFTVLCWLDLYKLSHCCIKVMKLPVLCEFCISCLNVSYVDMLGTRGLLVIVACRSVKMCLLQLIQLVSENLLAAAATEVVALMLMKIRGLPVSHQSCQLTFMLHEDVLHSVYSSIFLLILLLCFFIMPLLLDSVGAGIMFSDCPSTTFFRSFAQRDICCYHDIS